MQTVRPTALHFRVVVFCVCVLLKDKELEMNSVCVCLFYLRVGVLDDSTKLKM